MTKLWEIVRYDIAPLLWIGVKFWIAAIAMFVLFVVLIGTVRLHPILALKILVVPATIAFLWLTGAVLEA